MIHQEGAGGRWRASLRFLMGGAVDGCVGMMDRVDGRQVSISGGAWFGETLGAHDCHGG